MKCLKNFFKVVALAREIGLQGILDLSKDPLTGLENRGRYEVLRKEIARAHRYEKPLSLIVVDLDGLKVVNDTLGHLEGDKMIQKFADCIKKAARESDYLFRWGGDEFVIVLPETDLFGTQNFLKRVASGDQTPPFSWGVAEYKGQTPDELFEEAERKMYFLKKIKKARY